VFRPNSNNNDPNNINQFDRQKIIRINDLAQEYYGDRNNLNAANQGGLNNNLRLEANTALVVD